MSEIYHTDISKLFADKDRRKIVMYSMDWSMICPFDDKLEALLILQQPVNLKSAWAEMVGMEDVKLLRLHLPKEAFDIVIPVLESFDHCRQIEILQVIEPNHSLAAERTREAMQPILTQEVRDELSQLSEEQFDLYFNEIKYHEIFDLMLQAGEISHATPIVLSLTDIVTDKLQKATIPIKVALDEGEASK